MQYYHQKDAYSLEMYQRLIQYWSMMFNKRNKIHILDNMNFNLALFPQPLHPQEIVALHAVEPGYMSPDGSTELHRLIRELEYARLLKSAPEKKQEYRCLVEAVGVGCGNGCSNVINALINSILKFSKEKIASMRGKPEIISTLPNYTVYAAQLSNLAATVTPKYLLTKREHDFLPTFQDFQETVTENTLAFILTYPTNPAQSTFEGKKVKELESIVQYCQEKEIFLLVDNIYQDMLFPQERQFVEIFSLTSSFDYIVKIYGSSKDTPFLSGYRTGYWFGDPRLEDIYRYYVSSTENSLNTYSLVFFALNLYFKTLLLLKQEPTAANLQPFGDGAFGWSQVVSCERLFGRMQELDLYRNYQQRILKSNAIQEDALRQLKDFIAQSRCFSDFVNHSIGNVFFIKVDRKFFSGHDDDFFHYLFYTAHYGILPGNVFGMPLLSGEVWFRITLVHDTINNLLCHLSNIDDLLWRKKTERQTLFGGGYERHNPFVNP